MTRPSLYVCMPQAARAYSRILSDPREILSEIRRPSSSTSSQQQDTTSSSLRAYSYQISLSCTLTALQQFTGNAAILTYLPTILDSASLSHSRSIGVMVILAISKLLATAGTMLKIDRQEGGGRKSFLSRGALTMTAGLLVCSLAFSFTGPAVPLIAALGSMIAVTAFSTGFGPCTWLVIAEMLPTSIRGKALGIATVVNWLCNLLVVMTFLSTIKRVGPQATFFLYALASVLSYFFIRRWLPETMGKVPEEVASDVSRDTPVAPCCHEEPVEGERPLSASSTITTSTINTITNDALSTTGSGNDHNTTSAPPSTKPTPSVELEMV